jgi:RHS repeat-associated protein
MSVRQCSLLLAAIVAVSEGSANAAGGPQPGAVAPNTVKLPDGPGSIRGLSDEANVDVFSGQVSYSMPIEVPSAHGSAPTLSISYSGQLGNGPLGVGWTLGLPKIERTTRRGVPSYGDADELVLSGVGANGRLVELTDGSFRVEGAGHAVKVEREGQGYRVWDGNGTQYSFGTTARAQRGGPRGVETWLVEKVRTLTGGAVDFEYEQDQGEAYLTAAKWGPESDTRGRPYRVEFVYGSRPDQVVSYRTGHEVTTARRIDRVEVFAFGEVLRRYHLEYDQGVALSRLKAIRATGRGGAGELPKLTFHYGEIGPPEKVRLEGIGDWRLGQRGVSFADVDGDGDGDLLRLSSDGHSYRKNSNGTFGPVQPLTGLPGIDLYTARLADLNADAVADLVFVQNRSWRVYRGDGAAWTDIGTWDNTEALGVLDNSSRWMDINGDRLIDVVRWTTHELLIHYGRNGGLQDVALPPVPVPEAWEPQTTQFRDANGDGLVDALVVTGDQLRIMLGRGDGTFTSPVDHDWPWERGAFLIKNIHLDDLNRDGLIDVIGVHNGYVSWYPGLGARGFASEAVELGTPTHDPTTVVITDANGNGSQDVVWSTASGVWLMDLAGATNAAMLTGIDNGLGKETEFSYGSSAIMSSIADDQGEPWVRHLPTSIPVPASKVIRRQAGGRATTIMYRVRDGFWDREEQRFGGFMTGIERTWGDAQDGKEDRIVLTRFSAGIGDDRATRGMPMAQTISDGTGFMLTKTLSDVRAVKLEGGEAARPDQAHLLRVGRVGGTTVYRYEGVSEPIRTRVDYEYDGHGRKIAEHHQGRLDMTGDERERRWRYGSDDVTWVRDRVCVETTLGADDEVLSNKRTYYGDESAEHELCTIGKGWPRRVSGWLASEERWLTQKQTAYDARGNPVEVREGGVTRHLEYDASGLFAIAETVKLADGRKLSWRAEWDRVIGQPTVVYDAGGVKSRAGYDALGRLTSLALGDRRPHQHIRYHWHAPLPRTETYSFIGPVADVPEFAEQAPGEHWQHRVTIFNGAGEDLYSATRLGERWIIEAWKERDRRGQVVFVANPFYHDGPLPGGCAGEEPAASCPTDLVGQTVRYDPFGRVVAQVLPTGAISTTEYAAFSETRTSPGLAPVTIESDGLERPILTIRETERSSVTFDGADRLLAYELRGEAVATVRHEFVYDTLGRLTAANDPDIGERHLSYNDDGQLIAVINGEGEATSYEYDRAGRLTMVKGEDGTQFVYHYDLRHKDAVEGNTAGRLAWVEEPTGHAMFGYDSLGRLTRTQRVIDDKVATQTVELAAAGYVISRSTDDGLELAYSYDSAGRLQGIDADGHRLWEAVEVDARGEIVRERFGNGVVQEYQRDLLGQPSAIDIGASSGQPLYNVQIDRTDWGAISTIRDLDGTGLDHTASFMFDKRARLVSATIGQGEQAYGFEYGYDDLQNMVRRTVIGPSQLGGLLGTYRYGEGQHGPRQLTSIVDDSGQVVQRFAYDRAGRQVLQGERELVFNGLDQLTAVRGLVDGTGASGAVEHGYGYDGLRVRTVQPDGGVRYWFAPGLGERDGVREHHVTAGNRVIARIERRRAAASNPGAGGGVIGSDRGASPAGRAIGLIGLALIALLGVARRPLGWLAPSRFAAAVLSVALLQLSCAEHVHHSRRTAAAWVPGQQTYFHATVSAGPQLFTDEAGAVEEERRYEPFGLAIDAHRPTSGTGLVDFAALDYNILNKQTDPATGWSYHGARWMAPDSARWLSPDPPVKAPDATFVAEPWALHPYQYVNQNPVLFWDPDGHKPVGWRAATPDMIEWGSCLLLGACLVLDAAEALADRADERLKKGEITEAVAEVAIGAPALALAHVTAGGVAMRLTPLPSGDVVTIGGSGIGAGMSRPTRVQLTPRERPVTAGGVTGRVATRINLANGPTRFTPLRASGHPVSAGWQHVLQGHFNRPVAKNRSVFSVSPAELRSILQSPQVVRSPVSALGDGQFLRTADVGRTIGTSALNNGGGATSVLKVFTDEAGNLITAFPH